MDTPLEPPGQPNRTGRRWIHRAVDSTSDAGHRAKHAGKIAPELGIH